MSVHNIKELIPVINQINEDHNGDTRREWSIQDDCRDLITEADKLLKRSPDLLHSGPFLNMFYLNMDKLYNRVNGAYGGYYRRPQWFIDILKGIPKK